MTQAKITALGNSLEKGEKSAAAQAVATGTLVSGLARVRGIWIRSTAVAGTVVLKDGGAGGTEKITINTPAVVRGDWIPIPGDGLRFATDVHATLTNVDGITIVHD